MFWTDIEQARERLVNSYVMYDNRPFCVANVERRPEGTSVVGNFRDGRIARLSADDPLWRDFRHLPPTGWCNVVFPGAPTALYVERLPVRQRIHGLNRNNTVVYNFVGGTLGRSREYGLGDAIFDEEYCRSIIEPARFPRASVALDFLQEGQSAALSRKFAIQCQDGLFWLYRDKVRVGLFLRGCLNVLPMVTYTVDEIREETNLTGIEVVTH